VLLVKALGVGAAGGAADEDAISVKFGEGRCAVRGIRGYSVSESIEASEDTSERGSR
jgi:hypothetical protein